MPGTPRQDGAWLRGTGQASEQLFTISHSPEECLFLGHDSSGLLIQTPPVLSDKRDPGAMGSSNALGGRDEAGF